MLRLCLRNRTVFAFLSGFRTRETKPCCAPIFIRMVDCGRPTSVSVKPCQPDILRYNQTVVADMISVAKKIVTSASILYLLKTSPYYGLVERFPIAKKGHLEITSGRLCGHGKPASHFSMSKILRSRNRKTSPIVGDKLIRPYAC